MNDTAAKPINYRQFYQDVKAHFENLCTDRMRAHAGADVSHDLDVQVFRILGGYQEALDERDTQKARCAELEERLQEGAERGESCAAGIFDYMSGFVYKWLCEETPRGPEPVKNVKEKVTDMIKLKFRAAILGEKKEAEA